ncbi:MAG: hypothetical protein GC160_03110 [Acidobacteria bacterium]|nr:hypothetical protein [Acidobacteriota bacterium]
MRTVGLLFLLGAVAGAQSGDDARKQYKLGRKAEKQGRMLEAWSHYAAARAADPKNLDAMRGYEALRIVAAQSLGAAGALEASAELLNQRADAQMLEAEPVPLIEERRKPRQITEPVELEPEHKRADFQFKGKVREGYEAAAEEFGLRVIFDEEFRADRTIELELEFTDFAHVVTALNDLSGAFIAPITTNLFLVAEDNQNKRQQFDPVAAVSVPIPEAMTPEETNEIVQAVQQTLDIKRSFVSAAAQQVVLRDNVRKVRIAQELYRHLAQPKAEVVLDVELIAVSSTRRVQAGITLPTAYPITNFSTIWNAQAPSVADADATTLLAVGGGETIFGITIGSAAVTAVLNENNSARTLQQFRIRAAHGTEAELRIGEKFPIITAKFQPTVTDDTTQQAIDNGTFIQPIPSFKFEDLGLVFKATPTVHSGSEITLALEAEFRLLAGGSVNDVPILSNRSFKSQVRLEEGETAIISGMSILEARKNGSGLAGLAELPLIGKLFRSNSVQMNQSDLLLTITPRLVRLPAAEVEPSLVIRYGPEERPLPAL